MAIQVLCGSCKATFSVSDRFAGQTGPCPKCKAPIKIPDAPVKGVVVHEPEAPSTTSAASGRAPTAPLERMDRPISALRWTLVAVGAVLALVAAVIARIQWQAAPPPGFLLGAGAPLAIATAWLGYVVVRDRELAPYTGRSLAVRVLICAAVYLALWVTRAFLPEQVEMWQWIYYGPVFFAVGAFAAFACFDFEPGTAVAHFSLFLLVSATLRWIAGIPNL
ncbi:MAG: hypothetical protein ACKO5R_14645 [Planctomycetaceae bacterium]